VIVSGMILKVGIENASDALRDLVDANIDKKYVDEIGQLLEDIKRRRPEIVNISQLKGRTAGPYMLLDVDITVKPNLTVTATQQIIESIRKEVCDKYHSVTELSVHVYVEGQSTDKQSLTRFRSQSEIVHDITELVKQRSSEILGITHILCHYLDDGVTVEVDVIVNKHLTVEDAHKIALSLRKDIESKVKDVRRADIHCELSIDDIEREGQIEQFSNHIQPQVQTLAQTQTQAQIQAQEKSS